MKSFDVEGVLVDVVNRRTFEARVSVVNGRVADIVPAAVPKNSPCILPGLIDAHIHIESSMLPPAEFARLAVTHGTVATVSDPHEIANVLGLEGVEYMLEDAARVPLKIYFGCPSCVPATDFETAGARIGPAEVGSLLRNPLIRYLSEMMNFPGVLNSDSEVMEKIAIARSLGKPIDGHSPGLRGDAARRYAAAGISTDHECVSEEEARDKLSCGMKIIIREGSAAKNYEALAGLISRFPDKLMFCSDDKHPDDLIAGHIDSLVRRSIARGFDPFDVLQIACVNPVMHYGLDVGLLQRGDPADFILVDSLSTFNVLETYINGEKVAIGKQSLLSRMETKPLNNFIDGTVTADDLKIPIGKGVARVIEALDGQLITRELHLEVPSANGFAQSDVSRDILKIAVVNRYSKSPPALAFVKNFGLKRGAIASTVAHDSHNIVALGGSDEDLASAINLVAKAKGGISYAALSEQAVLPLPIAGLMSIDDGYQVARDYQAIDALVKKAGSTLRAPFMTLSFLALLVIPQLKLSDKGLFDGERFEFVSLFV